MKKINLLLVAFCLIVGSALAQKSTAYITTSSKQKIDDRTIGYTFQVDKIANSQQKDLIATNFKKVKGVFDVAVGTLTGDKCTYTVKMAKVNNKTTLQYMFVAADIEKVSINNELVDSAKLVEYLASKKEKK